MAGLSRSVGPVGAAAIGVASMVGAGVFYVFAPAADLAGEGVLIAVAIAGVIALLNALSIAQLSLHYPASGGVYSFATHYLSPRLGFLAGWLFTVGKTASAAAIALVAARYVAPDHAQLVAAGFVVVFVLVNITGIRQTVKVSVVIASLVVVGLVAVSGAALAGEPASSPAAPATPLGVLQAAGLVFFAFAGYARMATLGGEVRNPRRVLPRVIVGTLIAALILYALVGFALLWGLGAAGLAASSAPVAAIAPEGLMGVWVALAALASLGSLMTVLAALSRVGYAMSEGGHFPRALSRVWPRTSAPVVADATMGAIAVALVLTVDAVWLVGASSGAVLLYYAIAHASALAQPRSERVVWRGVPWLGALGCVVVAATLPLPSVATTLAVALAGLVGWEVLRRR